jgi:signal transduction histidine kinase
VEDDGVGFAPDNLRGMGMVGMEERLRQVGGTLRITSQPGKGTKVVAEVPVPPVADGNQEMMPLRTA